MTLALETETDNPAVIYRDSLSPGSYWAVQHSLTTIAEILDGEGTDPWSYPWWELTYRDTARVRRKLVRRYAPATVNKILTSLRGVLKNAWRLGLMEAEACQRASDVSNVRAKTLPAGRGVERDEVRALFEVCEVRIMSSDKDFYQLLDEPHVQIVNRARKRGQRLISRIEVRHRFGVTPTQWPDFRSLTGDPSDNIPGVRGVGKITAAKYLANGMALEDLRKSGRLTGAKGRAVLASWAQVLKWRSLIRLRTDIEIDFQSTGAPSPELPTATEILDRLNLW